MLTSPYLGLIFTTLSFASIELGTRTDPTQSAMIQWIRENPKADLKDVIRHGNQLIPKSGLPQLIELTNESFQIGGHQLRAAAPKNSCGKHEVWVNVVKLTPLTIWTSKGKVPIPSELAKVSKARVGGIELPRIGEFRPYSAVKGRVYFWFGLPVGEKTTRELSWWTALKPKVHEAFSHSPFLLVESTPEGYKFTDDLSAYTNHDFKEVRATKEELQIMPFSKTFYFPSSRVRVQIPQSCL